jgi:hypothetical protein
MCDIIVAVVSVAAKQKRFCWLFKVTHFVDGAGGRASGEEEVRPHNTRADTSNTIMQCVAKRSMRDIYPRIFMSSSIARRNPWTIVS